MTNKENTMAHLEELKGKIRAYAADAIEEPYYKKQKNDE